MGVENPEGCPLPIGDGLDTAAPSPLCLDPPVLDWLVCCTKELMKSSRFIGQYFCISQKFCEGIFVIFIGSGVDLGVSGMKLDFGEIR